MKTESPHTWPRLYVSRPFDAGIKIEISSESTHYLMNVLRTPLGAPVRIFNGCDGEWISKLCEPPKNKKSGALLFIETKHKEHRPCPDLWLYVAPIKKNHFDFVIQKATELGVRVIQPVLTAHTQIRDSNIARLRNIAIEAAEQSERLDVPEIREPVSFSKLIETWPHDRTPIVCAEFGNAIPVAKALNEAMVRAGVWVGPEGGYTDSEMEVLHNLPDVCAIRLGPRILRADTAALAALACWQALCGDWQESVTMRGERKT